MSIEPDDLLPGDRVTLQCLQPSGLWVAEAYQVQAKVLKVKGDTVRVRYDGGQEDEVPFGAIAEVVWEEELATW